MPVVSRDTITVWCIHKPKIPLSIVDETSRLWLGRNYKIWRSDTGRDADSSLLGYVTTLISKYLCFETLVTQFKWQCIPRNLNLQVRTDFATISMVVCIIKSLLAIFAILKWLVHSCSFHFDAAVIKEQGKQSNNLPFVIHQRNCVSPNFCFKKCKYVCLWKVL